MTAIIIADENNINESKSGIFNCSARNAKMQSNKTATDNNDHTDRSTMTYCIGITIGPGPKP